MCPPHCKLYPPAEALIQSLQVGTGIKIVFGQAHYQKGLRATDQPGDVACTVIG
jgi:hypothetical protein